ncbi:phosphate-starvation-inducible PsiE family protein [Nostoc sp. FACHB-110]|uniref:phosphate-starvation-inducible PsiE family protein n=1 Tax=Nostoc sp. FACHB-110 TaxID=2692834 RepID=UPI0016872AF7|nr:phosphate-starvation-inducible PsiE family protein [Nostoc sp. FACHB-110]MBD2436661.1 phosphate-starvation-inducible PsiE family protein [Nostoc sp. FACHB-110]
MQKRFKSRFLFCDRWLDRHLIARNMEAFQDLLVIVLCLSLFVVMIIQIWGIFIALTQTLDYKHVTAKILFVLILVELFRLLMIYLQEHSISVGVAVEVTIVSVLREVVVHGALEISWIQTAAICGLLFILGGLLIVCAKTPHMDCISANTKFCPIVYQGSREKPKELEFRYAHQCEENQPLT